MKKGNDLRDISARGTRTKRTAKITAALVACAIAVSAISPLTAFASAGGEPIDMGALDRPNYAEAIKCSVIFPYINGEDVLGSTLTGRYTLSLDGKSVPDGSVNPLDESAFQWYIGESRNGEFAPIEGETGKTYAIRESDLNKYIRFEVTPKSGGDLGRAIQSDPVGPVMSREEFGRISPRLRKEERYLQSRNNLSSEIRQRFSNCVYFSVDETYGGEDKTPISQIVGSQHYYSNGLRQSFESARPQVQDGAVMVNKAFVSTVLGAPDYDFAGADLVALDQVAADLKRTVFYGTQAVAAGANGNYRSTAQAEGLVIVSDTPIDIDVVADRDVLNEMVNQLYDLRASEEELAWFRDAKLGMFIHWDPGTMSGKEIGWGRTPGPYKITAKVPDYDLAYLDFDPADFDPADIARKAKEMGCKYLVFTSKHHGGFAMWNTNFFAEHSIEGTPYAERSEQQETDIIRQLADAVHAEGLKFGLYYSPQDWYNDYWSSSEHYRWMETYIGQLNELMSSYGKVDIFWADGICSALRSFDNPAPEGWTEAWGAWDPRTVLRRVKQLQPGIILNDRYAYRWEDPKLWDSEGEPNKLPLDIAGDYVTPEQTTGSFHNEYPWESCMTVDQGTSWSYNRPTGAKTPKDLAGYLINNTCNDGNLLLNIGLMPNGQFSQVHLDAFAELGSWLQQNAEAFYNTRGGPYVEPGWGGSAYRTNEDGTTTLYLHISPSVRGSHAVQGNTLTIQRPSDGKIYSSAIVLGHPEINLDFELNEEGYTFTLPEGMTFADGKSLSSIDTIIKLDENFDATVEYTLRYAEIKLEEMNAPDYPAVLERYRPLLEEKYNQLRAASEPQDQQAALEELKKIQGAIGDAERIEKTLVILEQTKENQVVGDHAWEMPAAIKTAIEARIKAAYAALMLPETDRTKLTAWSDSIQQDQDYFESLKKIAVVSFHPQDDIISPLERLSMNTDSQDLSIRYTTDGTDPTDSSKLYSEPFNAPNQGNFEIRAAAFFGGKQVGEVQSKFYLIQNAVNPPSLLYAKRPTTSNPYGDTMFFGFICDGNRNNSVSLGSTNSVYLTFDLQQEADFNTVLLFEKYYVGINQVRTVEIQYSNDGENFTTVASKYIQSSGSIRFDTVRARYLRVNMPDCVDPVISEIELYNVESLDMSYLLLESQQDTFLPGYYVPLSLRGEVNDQKVDANQVDYVVSPPEAGRVRSGVLRVDQEYAGKTITVTAQIEHGGGLLSSNTISLRTAIKPQVTASDASSPTGSSTSSRAFDNNDETFWMPRGNGPHWITANFASPGYQRIVVKEYVDTKVFNAPGGTKLGSFTLWYNDPATGEDVELFDSDSPLPNIKFTVKQPKSVKLTIIDGGTNIMYADENGNRALNVYEIVLPSELMADNIKFISKSTEDTGYRINEIEVYRPLILPERPSTDKAILGMVIDKAAELKGTDEFAGAIADVRQSFETALACAQEIFSDAYAFQEEIDGAWITLMTEIHKLGLQMGKKGGLESLISFAQDLVLENYVDGVAKDKFAAVFAKAAMLLEDENALQGEVDTMAEELIDALTALRLRADKSLLSETVDLAAQINLDGYTPESIGAFETAYQTAIGLLENRNLTAREDQAAVNQAVQNLLSAIYGLKKLVESDVQTEVQENKLRLAGDQTAHSSAGSPRTGEDSDPAALALVALLCAVAVAVCLKSGQSKS